MSVVYWVATVLLTVQATDSYILLTANFEDVQAIAKQLAESPVADQVKKIWRRAATQFNQYIVKNKPQMRAGDMDTDKNDDQSVKEDEGASSYINEDKLGRHNDVRTEEPRDTTYYLSSIKKVMESL